MVVLFDSENASVYIGHLCPALEGGEPPNYELYDAEEVMLQRRGANLDRGKSGRRGAKIGRVK